MLVHTDADRVGVLLWPILIMLKQFLYTEPKGQVLSVGGEFVKGMYLCIDYIAIYYSKPSIFGSGSFMYRARPIYYLLTHLLFTTIFNPL